MSELQTAVDGLVEAVDEEDVLFVLYWRLQLPEGSIDLEHSSTGLSALQTAVGDPSHSKRQRLIIEILLLSGAKPDSYGSVTAARLRASDVSNSGALRLFERWEHGARKNAAWLIGLTDEGDNSPLRTSAFDFIVANDLETEATKLHQQRVEEEARALAEQTQVATQASPVAHEEAATASSPTPRAPEGDSASTSAHTPSPPAPPAKRPREPTPITDEPTFPQHPPVSFAFPRHSSGASKKIKVASADPQRPALEFTIPIFQAPQLRIDDIPSSISDKVVEDALRGRLAPGVSLRLTPRSGGRNKTTATVVGEEVDLVAVTEALNGTELEGQKLWVYLTPEGKTELWAKMTPAPAAAPPPPPQLPEPVQPSDDDDMDLDSGDDVDGVPVELAPAPAELASVFRVLNAADEVNDFAIRRLFGHALKACGYPPNTFINSIQLLHPHRLVTLTDPVVAANVLGEMNGKQIGGGIVSVVRADQYISPLSVQPPPHLTFPSRPPPMPPSLPSPAEAAPTAFTDFLVHGVSKNTSPIDLEHAFAMVCDVRPGNTEIMRTAVVAVGEDKFVGHVRVHAQLDGSWAANLVTGTVIRGREVRVEWAGAGASSSSEARSSVTPRPPTSPPLTTVNASTSQEPSSVYQTNADGSLVHPPPEIAAFPPRSLTCPSEPTSRAAPQEPPAPPLRRTWGRSSVEAEQPAARSPDVALPTRSHSHTSSADSTATLHSTAPSSLWPAAHQQRTLDEARLASLGLSERDLATVRTLMQPIDTPPSEGFDRTARLEATFGYVSPEDARLALRAQCRRRTFADDERSQLAYETFLRAQTGESKDHYTVFFAELCRFNEESRLFEQTAKQALAAARATSGGK